MKKRTGIFAFGACITLCAVVYAQATWKPTISRAAVLTNARITGAKTYLPICDVARPLKRKAILSDKTVALKPKSGTFLVARKLRGKRGEWLFSGRWGFKVVSVVRAKKFQAQYVNKFNRVAKYEAENVGELVVIKCQLKNGTKKRESFTFATQKYGMNTGLHNFDLGSYPPDSYDVLADKSAPPGKVVLPGAIIPFNIIFRTAPGDKFKELVYSVVLTRERGANKSTDFRVALEATPSWLRLPLLSLPSQLWNNNP